MAMKIDADLFIFSYFIIELKVLINALHSSFH